MAVFSDIYRRAYDIIKTDAEILVLKQQGLLDGDGAVGIRHLERVPGGDYTTYRKIVNSWKNSDKSSVEKWTDAKEFVEILRKKDSGIAVSPTIDYQYSRADTYLTKQKMFDDFLDNILLQATLPRLDKDVSKFASHLLKAPFSIHKTSGFISLPIDPKNIDPNHPPSVKVSDLLEQGSQVVGDERDGALKAWSAFTEAKIYMQSVTEKLQSDRVTEQKMEQDGM